MHVYDGLHGRLHGYASISINIRFGGLLHAVIASTPHCLS